MSEPEMQTCPNCWQRVNVNDGTGGTHSCYYACRQCWDPMEGGDRFCSDACRDAGEAAPR